MEQNQFLSPNGGSRRGSNGPAYGNGNATSSTADTEQRLRERLAADEHISGIHHIDPDLQSHSNNAQQLAQDAMESLAQSPYTGHQSQPTSESPVVQSAAAAAAAAAARTKTSRACDECRRKKIRCDGSSEMEMGACSACKRSGRACAYSRTPQKRGPNRGYIRELTQRVELLERERHDLTPPIPGPDITFGHAESTPNNQPTAYVQSGTKRPLEGDLPIPQRSGVAPEDRDSLAVVIQNPQLIAGYFDHIHPYLPLLPSASEDLNVLFRTAPPNTMAAFTQALELCLQSPLYTRATRPNHVLAVRQALDTFNSCRYGDPQNLLQVHAGLLLVIDSINHGSTTLLNRDGFNPWVIWKDVIAVALDNHVFDSSISAPSTDDGGERRLALTLCTIETFMANANKKHAMTTYSYDYATIPRPEDRTTFGRRMFELNRITHVIRQILAYEIFDASDANGRSQGISALAVQARTRISANDLEILSAIKRLLKDLLQTLIVTYNFNEDSLIAMAFWYAHIILEVHFYPLADSRRILYPLRRLVDFFHHETEVHILTHHFAGLAAHTLFQLLEFNELRNECLPLLDSVGDTLNRIVPPYDNDTIDAALKGVVARKRYTLRQNASNLEQLANVAVGNREDGGADHGVAEAAAAAVQAALGAGEFSGARLSQDGYLTALLDAA